MPFGVKRSDGSGAQAALNDLETTNGFNFSDDLILPPELLDKKQKEMLSNVYMNNVGYYRLTPEEQKQEKESMEKLIDEISTRLKEYGGRIQPYVGSNGGSYTNGNEKSKTEYVVISINGVLIFEPIGQADNATYLGNEEELGLAKVLEKTGRLTSVTDGYLAKIVHTRTFKKHYDYESGHVLKIMKMANEHPKELLTVLFDLMTKQEYCTLQTLEELMNKCTVNNVMSFVGGQVIQRGVTSQEVLGAVSEEELGLPKNLENPKDYRGEME